MTPTRSALDEWKAGWPLPLVAAVGIAVFNMPAHSLGMFFAPLEADLGWSRTQITSGLLAMSIIAIFTIPIMGRLVDVKGARRIALPGVLLFGCAFAALGLPQSPVWGWWAAWMLLALAASWVSPVVWTAAVASRFDKGRGLAIAITLSGAGAGTIAAPLLANWLIETLGWRLAYGAMGSLFCLTLFPLAYLFFHGAGDLQRRSPGEPSGQHTRPMRTGSFQDAMRNSRFVRLVIATFLVALALIALVVHFVPILLSSGIAKNEAAEAAAFVGAGSIIGRIVAGLLLDRVHGTIVGFGAFSLPVIVSVSLLYWAGDAQMMYVTAFVLGFSLGSEVDVVAYLTSRYVGLRNFGSMFGISMSALALATGVGPFIGGMVYDLTGSYDYLLIGSSPLFLGAAVLVATLGPYPDDLEIDRNDEKSGQAF